MSDSINSINLSSNNLYVNDANINLPTININDSTISSLTSINTTCNRLFNTNNLNSNSINTNTLNYVLSSDKTIKNMKVQDLYSSNIVSNYYNMVGSPISFINDTKATIYLAKLSSSFTPTSNTRWYSNPVNVSLISEYYGISLIYETGYLNSQSFIFPFNSTSNDWIAFFGAKINNVFYQVNDYLQNSSYANQQTATRAENIINNPDQPLIAGTVQYSAITTSINNYTTQLSYNTHGYFYPSTKNITVNNVNYPMYIIGDTSATTLRSNQSNVLFKLTDVEVKRSSLSAPN